VQYQSQQNSTKTVADLASPEGWTFADLNTLSQIIETSSKSVKTIVKDLPAVDESIQELEKSLKKSISIYKTLTYSQWKQKRRS
jgi:hypothetical protein